MQMVKVGVGCVMEMPPCNSLWKLFVVQLAGSFGEHWAVKLQNIVLSLTNDKL